MALSLSAAFIKAVLRLTLFYITAAEAFSVTTRTKSSKFFLSRLQSAWASNTIKTVNNDIPEKLIVACERNRLKIEDTLDLPAASNFREEFNGVKANIWQYSSEVAHMSWMSALSIQKPDWTCVSITCWTGPLKNVPHLMTRVQVDNDILDVLINFCPRAHAAWDNHLGDGTFPEPNSRIAFRERELRARQSASFFTVEFLNWADRVHNLPGCQIKDRSIPLDCSGPARIEVRLPKDQISAAIQIMDDAVERYIQWMVVAERQGQVAAMNNYAFDIKTRPLLSDMVSLDLLKRLGSSEFAYTVAEQDAGPPDQADRSSSMANAALTNFEIDHMKEATEKD